MARLPEPAPVLLALGPVEADGAFAAGNLLELFHLVARGDGGAVELQEEHRHLLERQLGVSVDGVHLHLVEQLDAGDAEAELDGLDGGVDGAFERLEGADGGQDHLGDAVKADAELGNDAKRALGADEQPGEIVAGRRFAGAPAGLDDPAVGHHRGHVEDVVAHGAVADGVGAGGPCRRHAAEGRFLGARVDGEEEAHVAQVVVELLSGDAGLDDAIEIALVDGQDPVHLLEIDRDAAMRCVDLAFQRRAGAEWDDRDAVGGGDRNDFGDLRGGDRPDHDVGRLVGEPRQGVAVLAADGLARLGAFAEPLFQDGERRRPVLRRRFRRVRCHHPVRLPARRLLFSTLGLPCSAGNVALAREEVHAFSWGDDVVAGACAQCGRFASAQWVIASSVGSAELSLACPFK